MSSSGTASARSPYHHGDLRNALLATARGLAQEVGPDALTLREVARRAGVSHAAAYHHFADKNDLLRAIAVEAFTELTALLQLRIDATAGLAATLEAIAVDYLRFATERSSEFSFMWRRELCMPDGEPDPLKDAQLAAQHVVATFVRSRVGLDLAPTVDADVATLAFWSLAHGFTTIALETPAFKHTPTAELEALVGLALRQLLDGIAA